MKKIFSLVLVFTLVITGSFSALSFANTDSEKSEVGIDIELNGFYLHIPDYDDEEIIINKVIEDDGQINVIIVDKLSGDVLEQIKSSEDRTNRLMSLLSSSRYYTVQREKNDGLNNIVLETKVVLYNSGSFSSIQSIESTNIYLSSDGGFYEEGSSCSSRSVTGSFPTSKIEYSGYVNVATVTHITREDQTTLGLGVPELISLQYSVTDSNTHDIYVRKHISIEGEFRTY